VSQEPTGNISGMDDDEQRQEPDEEGATVLPAREAISIIVPNSVPDPEGDAEDDESSRG
jgi:hypothetical protein